MKFLFLILLFVTNSASADSEMYEAYFSYTNEDSKVFTCRHHNNSLLPCLSDFLDGFRNALPQCGAFTVSTYDEMHMNPVVGQSRFFDISTVSCGNFPRIFAVTKVYPAVITSDDIRAYDLRDLIVLCTAFLGFCLGWSSGLKT